jgi:hypothetical protein
MKDEHGQLLEGQPPNGSFELVAIVDGQDSRGLGAFWIAKRSKLAPGRR